MSGNKTLTEKNPPFVKTPPRLLTVEDIHQLERDNLIFALKTTGWRVSGNKGAASLLGMNPSTFASRMKKFGIRRPGE